MSCLYFLSIFPPVEGEMLSPCLGVSSFSPRAALEEVVESTECTNYRTPYSPEHAQAAQAITGHLRSRHA